MFDAPCCAKALPAFGFCSACRKVDSERFAASIARIVQKLDMAQLAFQKLYRPGDVDRVVDQLLTRDHVKWLDATAEVAEFAPWLDSVPTVP